MSLSSFWIPRRIGTLFAGQGGAQRLLPSYRTLTNDITRSGNEDNDTLKQTEAPEEAGDLAVAVVSEDEQAMRFCPLSLSIFGRDLQWRCAQV